MSDSIDLIQFSDLPSEVVYLILEKLPFQEKHNLKSVCWEWKCHMDDLLRHPTYLRHLRELYIQVDNDTSNPDANPHYTWYMWPKAHEYNKLDKPEGINICKLIGKEIIYYSFGMQDIPNKCEYWISGDSAENIISKRKKWALHQLEKEIGSTNIKNLLRFRDAYIKETVHWFNYIYPPELTKCPALTEEMCGQYIIVLLIQLDPFRIEYSLNGFTRNGVYCSEHDFKMYRYTPQEPNESEKSVEVWEGLGDKWSEQTASEILSHFKYSIEEPEISQFCRNPESNTISHIFEAIAYLVWEYLNGNRIPWSKRD